MQERWVGEVTRNKQKKDIAFCNVFLFATQNELSDDVDLRQKGGTRPSAQASVSGTEWSATLFRYPLCRKDG